MSNPFEDIEQMIDEIRDNDHLVVSSAELAPGEGADYVREVVEAHGLRSSPSFNAFFGAVGFVDIRYEVKPESASQLGLSGTPYESGAVYIAPIETVLSDRQLDSYWFNSIWEAFEGGEPPLLPIDVSDRDLSACSCCVLERSEIKSALRYFDRDTGLLPLPMEISEYAVHLKRSRTLYGWQHALAARARQHDFDQALQKLFVGRAG